MSNNRVMLDKISVVLEKLNSIQAQDQAQMNAHQRQVSNLQTQNFFRRNKPQVIAASSILFSLILIGTGIGVILDDAKLPKVPYGEKDPNALRGAAEVAGGTASIILGALLFLSTMMCVYIKIRTRRLISCLDSMPQLILPAAPLPTKISDHFISEQVEQLIKLSIFLVDAMDAKLEQDQKGQFKLFFPSINSGKSPEETLNNRVKEIKKSIQTQKLVSVLTQFQSHLEKNTLSKKSEAAIASALNECLKFCDPNYMSETGPLLGISIRQ